MNEQVMTPSTTDATRAWKQKVRWLALPTLTVIWLGVVGIGFSWMWEYEATPAEVTASLTHWPADSRMELNTDRPTLVAFVFGCSLLGRNDTCCVENKK